VEPIPEKDALNIILNMGPVRNLRGLEAGEEGNLEKIAENLEKIAENLEKIAEKQTDDVNFILFFLIYFLDYLNYLEELFSIFVFLFYYIFVKYYYYTFLHLLRSETPNIY
jgi:hypothetical protein